MLILMPMLTSDVSCYTLSMELLLPTMATILTIQLQLYTLDNLLYCWYYRQRGGFSNSKIIAVRNSHTIRRPSIDSHHMSMYDVINNRLLLYVTISFIV